VDIGKRPNFLAKLVDESFLHKIPKNILYDYIHSLVANLNVNGM